MSRQEREGLQQQVDELLAANAEQAREICLLIHPRPCLPSSTFAISESPLLHNPPSHPPPSLQKRAVEQLQRDLNREKEDNERLAPLVTVHVCNSVSSQALL